jgi:hypothetical protein
MNNPRSSQNTRFEELRKALHPIRAQLPPDGRAVVQLVTRDATSTVDSVKVAAAEALASVLRGSCDAGDPKFGSGSDF